jgi:hypothetical protein
MRADEITASLDYQELGVLEMLKSEHVPLLHSVDKRRRRVILSCCLSGRHSPVATVDFLRTQTPSKVVFRPPDVATMVQAGQPANFEVHDGFFRIARSGSCDPMLFVKSVFAAVSCLRVDIEEAGTTLSPSKLCEIEDALIDTVTRLLGGQIPGSAHFEAQDCPVKAENYIARRWVRGHQIFAVLTQCLIFEVGLLEGAHRSQDWSGVANSAEALSQLLRACAWSLELTGDYPANMYEALVRETMSPPNQPDGFSGLLSSDHHFLVKQLREAKPAMELLRDRDQPRHKLITDALAQVYDSHKYVCSRFVGSEKTSLLMAKNADRSGADQLEKFKAIRLKSVGGESR